MKSYILVRVVVIVLLCLPFGADAQSEHSATLSWIPSTSPVVGYNVYRSDTSRGPYRKMNTALLVETRFIDNLVQAGQTYYYVTTAVDVVGNESAYSNQIPATIPSP